MNIYWSYLHRKPPEADHYLISPSEYYDPVRLSKHIDVKETFGSAANCPSIIGDLKNTFVFKSPIDINMDFNNDMTGFTCNYNYPPELLEYILTPPDNRVLQIRAPMIIMFADQDVTATQLPPYLDDSHLNKSSNFISGTFNIGSWMRPYLTAFRLKDYFHNLKVSKGDVLTYIKVNTHENVNLIQFDSTELAETEDNPLQWCVKLKDSKPSTTVLSLEECYSLFNEKGYREYVLDWIKDRIVE